MRSALRFFKQLEFIFRETDSLTSILSLRARRTTKSPGKGQVQRSRRDIDLESSARALLRSLGAEKLARNVRVEWNPRLKTCAGRADYREKVISLNPLLIDQGNEVDRTLRHELAHLLAQWRVGRRRIAPHGQEWRRACGDLGIADETRCHDLPFASKVYSARYVYRCPNCKEEFPRVRKIRRAIACLACCRKYNGGDFDARFRLKLERHRHLSRQGVSEGGSCA